MTSSSLDSTTSPPTSADPTSEVAPDGTLVVEGQRFSIVPEWVIDAPITDSGFRLYSLLLRYGNSSGCRMPSRSTLARRLHRSVDAVDRAMRILVEAGIVRVEHRQAGGVYLANRYHVRTSPPACGGGRRSAATPDQVGPGGRVSAATPTRSSAATPAAELRPNPEVLTQSTQPPPPSRPEARPASPVGLTAVEVADLDLLRACGIEDLEQLSARCVAARTALGRPSARWSARCLMVVIRLAVHAKAWPAQSVAEALLTVAKDPATRSPARVAEAGPWWDATVLAADLRTDAHELADLEWRLTEAGGLRPRLQAQARAQLTSERLPITRATVARRACELLDQHQDTTSPAPLSEGTAR